MPATLTHMPFVIANTIFKYTKHIILLLIWQTSNMENIQKKRYLWSLNSQYLFLPSILLLKGSLKLFLSYTFIIELKPAKNSYQDVET